MKNKKLLLTITLLLIISLACIFNVFAHKGRTDSNGGHRDNDNQSGLGSYHFHCDGYPAHLHTNGVCPYTSKSSSASTLEELNEKYGISGNTQTDRYSEGYNNGKEYGEKYGYSKGFSKGKAEGKAEGKLEEKKSTAKVRWFTIPLTIGVILFLSYKAFFSKKN